MSTPDFGALVSTSFHWNTGAETAYAPRRCANDLLYRNVAALARLQSGHVSRVPRDTVPGARRRSLPPDCGRTCEGACGRHRPSGLAAVSALRREHDAALHWLFRAYDGGYRYFGLLERDPIMKALHGDQRFNEVLERMRHDVDTQRQRARERGLLDLQALVASQK
jgi:hypothetical protein